MSQTTGKEVVVKEVPQQLNAKRSELEAKLDRAIDKMKENDRSSLQSALELGGVLLEMKTSHSEDAKHGKWGKWLGEKAKACGMSRRTLQRAMDLVKYHKEGHLKAISGLQAAYDKILDIRRHKEKKVRPYFHKDELRTVKMSTDVMTEKIRELAGKRSGVSTVEISVNSAARLNAAIKRVLEREGAILLEHGGALLIKPAAQKVSKSGGKSDEKVA